MERINIETTQNVLIEHNIAGVGTRLVAQIIDFAFFFAYFLFFAVAMSMIGSSVAAILLGFPLMFYNLACDIFMQGQTFGKRIMAIKVVKVDGSQASIGSYFIRWIFRIVDIWLFSGLVAILSIALSRHGQRLGDMVADTTVISLKNNANLHETFYIHVPEGYQVLYPQVELLTDHDVSTANQVYRHCRRNDSETARSMAQRTKEALETKMGISASGSTEMFLLTILRDYNCLHRSNYERFQ